MHHPPPASSTVHILQQRSICKPKDFNLAAAMNSKVIFFFAVALVTLALLAGSTDAASYKKPLFNGSIFGKRANGATMDTEYRGAAFSALCEVALEACSSLMPAAQDSK